MGVKRLRGWANLTGSDFFFRRVRWLSRMQSARPLEAAQSKATL